MVISAIATDHINAASFQLTWLDNSEEEDGFHVERKQGINGTFSLIATVGRNVESYSDGNLADSTTYCYRLNSFNSGGKSAYSNEACGTTAPANSTPTFDFSLSNGGNKSVTQGQSVTTEITATLTQGQSQRVSFSTSGLLPSGATISFTPSTSCNPTCSRTLNIVTTASSPAASYTITVKGAGGGLSRSTSFTLTVNAPTSSQKKNFIRGRGRRR
jgi:archaellum component FlaF (FlaF/FlaG flagellin family)